MAEDMIERVAKAIRASMRHDDDTVPYIEVHYARAAIEAMREPTAAMIDAYRLTQMNIQGGYEVSKGPWAAAIDAALSPTPQARKDDE